MNAIATVQVALGRLLATPDQLGPSDIDLDDVRDRACDVTASDEVCSPPRIEEPDLPDVSSGGGASPGGGAFGQVLVVLLVGALLAALAWLVWQFVAGRSERATDDEELELDESDDLDEEVPRLIDEERPPDRWRRAAADHRGRGEYRDAIRCEYRALVGDLARAGHVDEIPGRTSGEERVQVRDIARPGSIVPGRFDEAAELFDCAWFDDDVVTDDDDRRFTSAATAVLDGVLSGSGRGRGS